MYAAPTLVDDEGTYTAQAWAIEHWHTLAHYTYWYDHPPIGWLVIAAWTWPTQALSDGFVVGARVDARRPHRLVPARLRPRSPARPAPRLRREPSRCSHSRRWRYRLPAHGAAGQHRRRLAPRCVRACVLTPERRLAAFAGSGACFAGCSPDEGNDRLLVVPALVVHVWLHADTRTRAICLTVFAPSSPSSRASTRSTPSQGRAPAGPAT